MGAPKAQKCAVYASRHNTCTGTNGYAIRCTPRVTENLGVRGDAPLSLARHLPSELGRFWSHVSSGVAARRYDLIRQRLTALPPSPEGEGLHYRLPVSLPIWGRWTKAGWGLPRIPAPHPFPYAYPKSNPWAPQKRKSALSMPRGTTHAPVQTVMQYGLPRV